MDNLSPENTPTETLLLQDFINQEKERLGDFGLWWYYQRRTNPSAFAKELTEADWQEQYSFFKASHEPLPQE